MARVVFENVRKEYEDVKRGSFTAVAGSSFVIEDKEFVVFVGPSGCGKTTSLRMIAGLEQQTSGDILIGDRVVNQLHPKAAISRWCFKIMRCIRI